MKSYFGTTLIFMLKDLGDYYFPEVSVESVLNNSYTHKRRDFHWNRIKNMPWVKIE